MAKYYHEIKAAVYCCCCSQPLVISDYSASQGQAEAAMSIANDRVPPLLRPIKPVNILIGIHF
jgi:hypothetical protein